MSPTPPNRTDDDRDRWPGFRDVTEIGRGASATVYRATEIDTGRPVALKALARTDTPSARLEALRAETRALQALGGHPNIVTLYGTVTDGDGRRALVLELCRGSYAELVQAAGPLPVADVVGVGIKVAGALEAVHRAGIIHRDVNPRNVLRSAAGEPALSDFGVAAIVDGSDAGGEVFRFTTLHAAPEVLEGHDVSPATDVYGLASTLVQLVTGRPPFAPFAGEATAAVILRILRDPAPPLLAPDIPLALSDLLGRALAKDPGLRPASAARFADELREVEEAAGWSPTPGVLLLPPAPPAPPPALPAPLGGPTAHDGPAGAADAHPPPGDTRPAETGPEDIRPDDLDRTVVPQLRPAARVRPPASRNTASRKTASPNTASPIPGDGRAALLGAALGLTLLGVVVALVLLGVL